VVWRIAVSPRCRCTLSSVVLHQAAVMEHYGSRTTHLLPGQNINTTYTLIPFPLRAEEKLYVYCISRLGSEESATTLLARKHQ